MVVSRNRCTPKSSTSIGFSIMNKPFWVPPCLETSKQSSWYLIALFDEVSGRSCCFEDICGKPNDSWMDGQTIPNHDRFTALEWPNDPCSAGPYRPTNTVTKQTSQFLLSKYMSIWCALFADSIPDNSPLTCMKLWFFRSSTVNICHILKSYSIFEYLQMCFFQTMFGHCFFFCSPPKPWWPWHPSPTGTTALWKLCVRKSVRPHVAAQKPKKAVKRLRLVRAIVWRNGFMTYPLVIWYHSHGVCSIYLFSI